uniref:Uncharacterized protein n=1 Tax=Daphnia galeata TaxID=27404 RepID=A0A8J2WLC5_9CRUS|nr:unnamed protein product [Daphnia galeata]
MCKTLRLRGRKMEENVTPIYPERNSAAYRLFFLISMNQPGASSTVAHHLLSQSRKGSKGFCKEKYLRTDEKVEDDVREQV